MRLTGSGFVKWPQLKRWRGSLSSSHSIVTNTLFIIAITALKHGLLIAVSFDHVDMLKCIEWSLIYSSVWSIHSAWNNVISSTCVYQPFHVKTSALKKGLKQAWLMEVLPIRTQRIHCQHPGVRRYYINIRHNIKPSCCSHSITRVVLTLWLDSTSQILAL